MTTSSSVESFLDAKKRYADLRDLVYEVTNNEFASLAISCREISFADAQHADNWRGQWSDREKIPVWEWKAQYNTSHGNNGMKRFDIALCTGGQLWALCYGMPTKRKLTLKLHTLARNPASNPLAGRILEIVLFASDAYARLLGCREIWLVEPMNDQLVSLYQSVGYTAYKNRMGHVTHMVMEVEL